MRQNLPFSSQFFYPPRFISLKTKVSLLFFVILFSFLSGVGELMTSLDQKPEIFVKNISSQKVPEKEALRAYLMQSVLGSSTAASPSSQFTVMQVREGVAKKIIANNSSRKWGLSKQIDEHTWTIKVANDKKNANAQEIFGALNAYRQKQNKSALTWDASLADFAQSRANSFNSAGVLDGHKGFSNFINNDGFKKLGFGALGENSSIGYILEATHLIEWVYAGDKPHDDNQLNNSWSSVGIGVNGTATDLVFGGKKL
jgi:uncharacterized protein YkwD